MIIFQATSLLFLQKRIGHAGYKTGMANFKALFSVLIATPAQGVIFKNSKLRLCIWNLTVEHHLHRFFHRDAADGQKLVLVEVLPGGAQPVA